MDFFTVPTLTFGVLHCFFVISHDRRRILHWNVTRHPTNAWVAQQLREAFPYDPAVKYLIFDRASSPLLSKVTANPDAEFIHELRFVPACDFGEGQVSRDSCHFGTTCPKGYTWHDRNEID
jgi:hypothetical protein